MYLSLYQFNAFHVRCLLHMHCISRVCADDLVNRSLNVVAMSGCTGSIILNVICICHFTSLPPFTFDVFCTCIAFRAFAQTRWSICNSCYLWCYCHHWHMSDVEQLSPRPSLLPHPLGSDAECRSLGDRSNYRSASAHCTGISEQRTVQPLRLGKNSSKYHWPPW